MSNRIRVGARVLTALVVSIATIPAAHAFYPLGFFDPLQNGALVYVKWPLDILDTNGDGDVSGDEEGVRLNFEVGNGADGFDTTEAEKIFTGLQEWERVSTCYIAFSRGPNITDTVELTDSLDSIDAFNMVALLSDDEIAAGAEDVTNGSLGVTLNAYAFEDTFVTIGNSTFPITGGQIIDSDIIFSESARIFENQEGGLFKSGGVILGGLAVGLGWSPLTNFDEDASDIAGRFIESKEVAIRNADGTLGRRGVTSSMFDGVFYYDAGGGNFIQSGQDLAPDDIAGITFLYPRTDVDLFFNLSQRARTQARENFASRPINGSWIRAWCDADNNDSTSRVPMIDTLTGLYYDLPNETFAGHFILRGMYKQLETLNEQTFAADYSISSSEFLPLVFEGDERSTYDTTHGASANGISFDTLYPAEVYNETGNLFGLSGVNQGTSLVFDLATRKIISQDSGKTLDVLLATGRPMFGDQDQVCPLNVVVSGLNVVATPKLLRGLRDNILLQSAVGVALVDLYYRLAPSAAHYLVTHGTAFAVAQWGISGVEWLVVHAEVLAALAAALLVGSMIRGRKQRLARAAAAAMLLAAVFVPAAYGQHINYTMSEYLSQADDVVVGEVMSNESRWTQNNTRIITDVLIKVGNVIKGTQNTGGQVHLEFPTGRVGAIVRTSPSIPAFTVGEEVLVFLREQNKGYMVVGGVAGKYAVKTNPRTGEKFVAPTSMAGHTCLLHEVEAMAAREQQGAEMAQEQSKITRVAFDKPVAVKLDKLVDHLRAVEKEQRERVLVSAPAR